MENSKTALADYRHLFSRIDEKGLTRGLELALDRQLIVKLLHICGLVRDGRDLATTAMHTLAAQLAGDCFEREVTAAQVIRTLVQTSSREIEQIGRSSPEGINSLLSDRTDAYTRECGRMTFAMLLDEREAVYAPAIERLNRIPAFQPRSGVSEETASPYLRDDPVLNGGPEDARRMADTDPALIEARRYGADLEKRNRILEDRVREMQRRIERFSEESGAESERVALFIDVQNMWYAARQQHGMAARVDFEKLMQAAVSDRRLIRAYAYVIQTPEVDQSGFVTMLEQFSYEVKRKDLRRRSDGSAKGDWDMEMAIDMIRMAEKVDVVILASGDGDFVSLIQLLKELGPRVEVFSFPHNTARDLMETADHYHPIDASLLIEMGPAR
ncbi:MAG: NYN domain-containing protein [Gemmatimonadota bacterium]|nr:NYN domain-containing protein [Gemmatimonadota bacterium]